MDVQNVVFDLNQNDFVEKAVEASTQRVIVVDFWADWCGPCKMLGPLLEQIVLSYGGRVMLAKVNVDENQALAAQFGVRSIPTVKILKDKAIANEFVGALTEPQIREMLDPLVDGEATEETDAIEDLIAEGRTAEAREKLEMRLSEDATDSKALLGLAKLDILDGDTVSARNRLESIEPDAKEYDTAQSTLAAIEFLVICNKVDDRASLAPAFEAGDLEAGYTLGCCFAAEGSYREALGTFLAIVKKDRIFADGKAREAMVSVFGLLGTDNELTGEYRQKLASVLF